LSVIHDVWMTLAVLEQCKMYVNELLNRWRCVSFAQDTNIGVPVTMHVDPKGYFVYWHDQNQVYTRIASLNIDY